MQKAGDADRVRAFADLAARTVADAFLVADGYWEARARVFDGELRRLEAEVLAAASPRASAADDTAAPPTGVSSPACEALAARQTSACAVLASAVDRQMCMSMLGALAQAAWRSAPSADLCARYEGCPGECCRTLYGGSAAGGEAVTAYESYARSEVQRMQQTWWSACAPGGAGMECITALFVLAHRFGDVVCDWPAELYGARDYTAAVEASCLALLWGRPELCPIDDDVRPTAPLQLRVASTLVARSGVGWWGVGVVTSAPAACHVVVRATSPGGGEALEVGQTLFTGGVAVAASRWTRLGARADASRAQTTTRAVCAPVPHW